MQKNYGQLGVDAFNEAIQGRADLRKKIFEAYNASQVDSPQRQARTSVFDGMLSSLAKATLAVQKAGRVPHYPTPKLDEFMHSGPASMALDLQQALDDGDSAWLTTIFGAMADCVMQPGITVEFPKPKAEDESLPPPSAPGVTVVVQPADVVVNNAFAKTAVQTVQRDAHDEIISTTTNYTA